MDTLDRINEINDRLAELRPVARECERLQQAHAALAASGGPDDTTHPGGSPARRVRTAARAKTTQNRTA